MPRSTTNRSSKSGQTTRQKSFRWSKRVLDLLDSRAQRYGTTGNRLAEQLLDEALHTEAHPLIHFRPGRDGRRRPALLGTRLYVSQVINTIRASDGSVPEAAEYLDLRPAQVQACVSYYAEFRDEVDALANQEQEFARQEQERWEREQEVLA
jgi:uncharacterized protein (DUF433 family)